jgi:hypothetical protein
MIVDQSEYHSSVHSYDLQFVFQSDLIDKHHVHQQNTVFDQGNSQQGLKNNSARTRKTATTQDNAVNYTKIGQPLYYSAPSSNYFLGITQILPERHKMYSNTIGM